MDDVSGPVSLAATTAPPVTDLVLEGGGVKGIGLVGAVQALSDAGYGFARVAGTSVGAMVAALLAALDQRGEPIGRLDDIARTLDYTRFRDRRGSVRWLGALRGPFALLADALAVAVHDGAYRGRYLHDWIGGVLGDLGVHTFGDLLLDDPDGDGAMHHRYRLVVLVSDVSRRRLLHLPWDFGDYGLDADEQSVADAVRASASTPYLFEPVSLHGAGGTATLVDGGLLSNFPIAVFDRTDGRTPRWPTIGVRLDALRPEPTPVSVSPVGGPVRLGVALIETAIEGCQDAHVLERCNLDRSIHVDTQDVDSFDFDLTDRQQRLLLAHGRSAAEDFLSRWDYDAWLQHCR